MAGICGQICGRHLFLQYQQGFVAMKIETSPFFLATPSHILPALCHQPVSSSSGWAALCMSMAAMTSPRDAPRHHAARSTALMRVCQPGQVALKAASMAAPARIFKVGRFTSAAGLPTGTCYQLPVTSWQQLRLGCAGHSARSGRQRAHRRQLHA